MKPRTRMTRNSVVSPAPIDCAAKAVVLMRTKANSQNRQSKMTEAIATPPSMAGSPRRPIAVVETMPINGVVRFAIIAGPAMANTCRVVTLVGKGRISIGFKQPKIPRSCRHALQYGQDSSSRDNISSLIWVRIRRFGAISARCASSVFRLR